ncbi:MAG: 6-phosphofructokinase [Candidatus Comchoanobacterales bacterium]
MTNIFFAHSGGVTSVLNGIAASVITQAQQSPHINRIFIGRNGIIGALNNEMYDVTDFTPEMLEKLARTPASAFGSCRYKLKCPNTQASEFETILKHFKHHNITGFIYNGGNDSQDTTLKMHEYAQSQSQPLNCVGIPKTIDNDLPMVDCCPGYPSAAKYLATSIYEASLDILSMCRSSTKVFVMEVMGRHAGWLAAATAMANTQPHLGPHIILLPEVLHNEERLIQAVKQCVADFGCCVIAVSEGLLTAQGKRFTDQRTTDAFGHTQLGGIAPIIAHQIHQHTGFKYHWSVVDYLQRSAGHLTSSIDHQHAIALGREAILALNNKLSGIMVGIHRINQSPYEWKTQYYDLKNIANIEKKLPPEFIREDQLGVTPAFKDYLRPLIQGEPILAYRNGLPDYFTPLTIQQLRTTYAT